jgi:hypothetical protein
MASFLDDITGRLAALLEEVDEAAGRPLMASERIQLIRQAAQIAQDADELAEAGYASTKTLTGDAWDRALTTADAASDCHSRASRLLQRLICGTPKAVAQMEAIERRCRAGGF